MYGKLGHGDENGHAVPVQVSPLSNVIVIQVACGSRHTVVLTQSQEVYAWGDKENGVSGHSAIETEGHQYAPRVVSGLRGVNCTQVAACGFHTAALTETGKEFAYTYSFFFDEERNYHSKIFFMNLSKILRFSLVFSC